jgi:hypothetical protein
VPVVGPKNEIIFPVVLSVASVKFDVATLKIGVFGIAPVIVPSTTSNLYAGFVAPIPIFPFAIIDSKSAF